MGLRAVEFKPVYAEPCSAPISSSRSRSCAAGIGLLALAGGATAAILGVSTNIPASSEGPAPGVSQPTVGNIPVPGTTPSPSPSPSTPGLVDVFVTRSGHWRLSALPAQGDAAVYRMTLEEKPGFVREFACRPLFTKEARKGIQLSLLTVKLLGAPASVAQGACRVVQNMQPVAPRLDWIRAAVANRTIPAYQRETAWVSGLEPLVRHSGRQGYDPMSLGPRFDGASTAPTSSHNFVGVTSSQGGEYTASRGFLHDADARVVDAALHNEQAAITAYWPEFEQYTFYSLAQPQGAAWSAKNHVTIDPQFPQDGERGWELPFHNNPNPRFDTALEVTGWGRDVAHLENTGFVHWLATEDPVAGFLVQRQAAYALAGRREYQRGGYAGTLQPADTRYEGYADQERGIFNTLSVLWKSRDVSRRIASAEGRMFWSATRVQAQADQVIAFYDQTAERVAAATIASPADYTAKLSGTPFTTIGIGGFLRRDGVKVKMQQTSAFESVQYGKEPLWLWTKAGNPTVRRWFTAYATGLAARMAVIGGAMGVDGRTSSGGSGYPTGPTKQNATVTVAAAPPFNSTTGWAEWVAALPLKQVDSRTNFNGASVHTAMQMEATLLMARDAALPIPQLDSALSRIKQGRAATTAIRYPGLQMHKHLGSPAL